MQIRTKHLHDILPPLLFSVAPETTSFITTKKKTLTQWEKLINYGGIGKCEEEMASELFFSITNWVFHPWRSKL